MKKKILTIIVLLFILSGITWGIYGMMNPTLSTVNASIPN